MIFDRARAATQRAFQRHGTPCQIHRATNGTVDRITGVRTSGQTVVIETIGFLDSRKVKADDGTERVEAIAKLLAGNPQPGDKLVFGKTYVITSVQEKNPDGGIPLSYIVGLK